MLLLHGVNIRHPATLYVKYCNKKTSLSDQYNFCHFLHIFIMNTSMHYTCVYVCVHVHIQYTHTYIHTHSSHVC